MDAFVFCSNMDVWNLTKVCIKKLTNSAEISVDVTLDEATLCFLVTYAIIHVIISNLNVATTAI